MPVQDDNDAFLALSWHAVFWDEAGILKNHTNRTYLAACMLETPYRCDTLYMRPLATELLTTVLLFVLCCMSFQVRGKP